MPGSAVNPWADELKGRKKSSSSTPRKNSTAAAPAAKKSSSTVGKTGVKPSPELSETLRKTSERKKSQEMAKTQEYLRLNYPADIRRNLKGLNLPEDSKSASGNNNLAAAKNAANIDVVAKKKAAEKSAKKTDPEDESKKKKDGEWEEGEEEDEWEWEEDEEAGGDDEPDNSNNKPNNTNGGGILPKTNGINHTQNEDDDDDDSKPVDAKGVPDIKIQGNVLKIDRKDVVWSDDEYEEDDEEEEAGVKGLLGSSSTIPVPPPPPPPPPPMTNGSSIPLPPPPPPGSRSPSRGPGSKKPNPNNKVELLKKRPTKRPDWNDLMAEIEQYKGSCHGLLRKVKCNDRSRPILTATKMGASFIYDSEKDQANKDILVDIKKGKRLRHVKTNDRSKPNLRGIRQFRRQCTKEERQGDNANNAFSLDDDLLNETEDPEDVDNLRDDLESTKQLLELEIRSKKLLEKDNKKMQQEMERMRQEFVKLSRGEEVSKDVITDAATKARRDSVASKRQSMIMLITESESSANIPEQLEESGNEPATNGGGSASENGGGDATMSPPIPRRSAVELLPTYERGEIPEFEKEVIENMKEEVDEARKLAEEWESRYKEMQRQVTEIDHVRKDGKRTSLTGADIPPSLQRMVSNTDTVTEEPGEEEDEGTWMQKRELHQQIQKFRSIADKREVVQRERKLLQDRVDTIVGQIGKEVEARKKLRKEVNEMNEAFKDEILDMESEEITAKELEECYFSDDEELVVNQFGRQAAKEQAKKKAEEKQAEFEDEEEEEEEGNVEETLDDIIKLAEEDEDGEEDPGHHLFEAYPESDDDGDGGNQDDFEKQIDQVNGKIERHGQHLGLMRKSNFMLKSKIDRLYDILQMQREQHHDLKQELARMLADIQ